jgi:two-component system, cell cycle sensor histidine kinase and response regulator CckA
VKYCVRPGIRVLNAKNAVEAIRLYEARRGEVNLLLTDMILPGETGSSLAKRLRLEDPGLKVLLVTGYADQLGRLEAKQQECLGKPFSSGMLLGRVRRLLDVDGLPTGMQRSAYARLR